MPIEILVLLILVNGLFAMSEIALVTARKVRLQQYIDEGDRAALAALKLGADPTRFLSTIQIGITSIGVLNGIVGEAALAGPFSVWLVERGLGADVAYIIATGMVVVIVTYASIVLGELVPKRYAQTHPETIARLVARPIDTLAMATKPFVVLLTASTELLLRLLGVRDSQPESITEAEIHALLEEGTQAGVIESDEHEMVRNVFRLDDRSVGSLIVPRPYVATLDVNDGFEEHLAEIRHSDHTRYPVVDGDLDSLRGLINARQWLSSMICGGSRVLGDQPLIAPVYVPETQSGMELLQRFRTSALEMAFVIDEYGIVVGIVTASDLLEAITGEINPDQGDDALATQRPDGSWLIDGHIGIEDFKARLGLSALPEEWRGRYHTLSGMMMLLLGRLPEVADVAEWQGWRLEIVDMDGKTIDKVLASPLGQALELTIRKA